MKTRICTLLSISIAVLAGCEPQQPQVVPAPPVSTEPATPAPAAEAAPVSPAPAPASSAAPVSAQPAGATAALASSAPAPAAATAPSTTPIDKMAMARPSGKVSVAVDLRYELGPLVDGQPVSLQLAAVPRVAGNRLNVEIPPATGLEVTRGALSAQKAEAGGVYRQQYSLTRRPGAARELSVLVTMDMPEGTAFGFFAVPLDAGNTAQKSDSVKQR